MPDGRGVSDQLMASLKWIQGIVTQLTENVWLKPFFPAYCVRNKAVGDDSVKCLQYKEVQ